MHTIEPSGGIVSESGKGVMREPEGQQRIAFGGDLQVHELAESIVDQ
jgi:hypothetical protein